VTLKQQKLDDESKLRDLKAKNYILQTKLGFHNCTEMRSCWRQAKDERKVVFGEN